MPSNQYMTPADANWDFFPGLVRQPNNYPLFLNNYNADAQRGDGPFSSPWGFARAFPYRGAPQAEPEPEPERNDENTDKEAEKDNEQDEEMNSVPINDNGEGPSHNSGPDNEGCAGRRGRRGHDGDRRKGHCGRGGRDGFGGPWGRRGCHDHRPPHGPHGFYHGSGPHHGGPHGFGRRGGWGPWGRGFMSSENSIAQNFLDEMFWDQFNKNHRPNTMFGMGSTEDHVPDADIFDTETAYIVHLSLPGAKKEDVGVNWNAEKSELSVAGVIYRPGDEEFLKSLAMNERKVGPFERKIFLGTMATPAHVDADGITAKLEDGVLRVEVPKLDAGYIEIKKVDIE